MKKIIIILALLATAGAINSAAAQNVNINININSQPDWGPIGYEYVEFYYFPEINVYYDIMHSMFYYRARSRWVSSRYLPDSYRRYDLYGMYKVVINHEPQPWLHNRIHKRSYTMYRNDRTQTAIRYSNDGRYSTSRNNHVRWTQPVTQPQSNIGNTTNSRRQSSGQNVRQNNQNDSRNSQNNRSATTNSRTTTNSRR